MSLDKIRASRKEEKAVIEVIKDKITEIVAICGLDEDKSARRIQVALKSEYGRVNGMINLLAAICKWPAEAGDGAAVSLNQSVIESELKLDLLLLEDISSFKGFHTFHTDELDVIDGTEPDYQNYQDYCTLLLEELGFERTSASIEATTWKAKEKRAKVKTKEDVKQLVREIEAHKHLLEAA